MSAVRPYAVSNHAMKIKYRFLMVFVLVTVITAGVLVAAFDSHRSDLQADVNADIERNAATAVGVLDNRLTEQQQTIDVAAAHPALRADNGTERQLALDGFVERSSFNGASVIDADGEMVAIAGVDETTREAVVGQSFADRPYVSQALANETYISEPFVADTGNNVVVISTPLRDQNGTVVGALTGSYHLNETELFEPLDDESSAIGLTVVAGGTTLYSTADAFDGAVSHSRELSTVGWVVTSQYELAAINQELRELAVVQLVIGITLIGTITGFSVWVYQSEIRHIERLHHRIENLKQRKYEDDIEFDGAAEWQQIGAALNQLSATLSSREQMLLVVNRFLRHNLRNELNVVTGYAAEIHQTTTDPQSSAHAEKIQSSTESILSTAERVRLTEKLIDPATAEHHTCELISLLELQIERITSKHPSFTVELTSPESVHVIGCETLPFAVSELLTNVVDHAGESPAANITVTTNQTEATIRICDSGPGIPADETALLSGKQAITPLNHSSGLGLWLVNWIVSRHGGTLSIPETDDGTTVVITLLLPTERNQPA